MKNYNLISTASKSKQKIPHCVHGPNLLLEDLNETIPEYKRKYVCSAVRSNDCKPFLNFDSKKFVEHHSKKRKNFQNRLIQTLKSPKEERKWCVDCSILLLPEELEQHEDHFVKGDLTLKQLRLPTKLISANVEKKEEAQYFFSDQSLKVILKCIVRCKFTHVLCIGCPSIHEQLLVRNKKLNIQSFLLDIDSRYLQFYSSKQYLCFNMANNYLFEKDKYEENLNQFLSNSSKLLIIADPPFGIMIPALADTLTRLKKKINYFKKDDTEFKMSTMLFHLYFYEKRIRNVLPELKMMDYKISYSNHKKMKEDSNSIARLFTDIDSKQIVLKGLQDYKYCGECERWVHAISVHCEECKNCCSKDGKPSGHCSVCDKCVRETYVHCFTCEICTREGECKCGHNSENKLVEYYSDDEFNYNNDNKDQNNTNKDQDMTANENVLKDKLENGVDQKMFVEETDWNPSDSDKPNNFERRNLNFKNGHFNKNKSFGGMTFDRPNSFSSRGKSFGSGERKSNFQNRAFGSRERNFRPRERGFGSRGGSFSSRGRDFNSKDNGFGSRGGSLNSRRRDFNSKDNGFESRERKFNRSCNGRDHFERGFKQNEITSDDFNKMFFNKGSSGGRKGGFKKSFDKSNGFKRSNDSFGRRPMSNPSFKPNRSDY